MELLATGTIGSAILRASHVLTPGMSNKIIVVRSATNWQGL